MGSKNTILVTGANGMLGSLFVRYLFNETEYDICTVTREGSHALSGQRIRHLSNEELMSGSEELEDVYAAVHFAFSRRTRPASEIADSIRFSGKVFEALRDGGVKRIVNISTQAVYGLTDAFRAEDMPAAPESIYAMAKYASECILESTMRGTDVDFTNLRLDLIAQSQPLVPALCKQALEGEIHLRGGMQEYSFLDAADVAPAIAALLETKASWGKTYNVGWNRFRISLNRLASLIASAAAEYTDQEPAISLEKKDIPLWYGMESEKFMKLTGWRPCIPIEETIQNIVEQNFVEN